MVSRYPITQLLVRSTSLSVSGNAKKRIVLNINIKSIDRSYAF